LEQGILSLPDPKQGNRLSNATAQMVTSFYHDEELTREMPGNKDSVNVDSCQEMQKCLILCNSNELFATRIFKHLEIKLRFYTFCSLRPKWCILLRAAGTRSFIVCVIHQSMKLLPAPFRLHYKDLIWYLACDIDN